MIKLENNEATQRAITRAAQNHNFVASLGAGQYLVLSGKSQTEYTVKLIKGTDGHAWANCTCPAGVKQQICHHVVSASWIHKAIYKMRKAAR